jgi:hypothetical protein
MAAAGCISLEGIALKNQNAEYSVLYIMNFRLVHITLIKLAHASFKWIFTTFDALSRMGLL